MKNNNLITVGIGLLIGLLIGIYAFNPNTCGKNTDVNMNDSLYKIKRERDSSLQVISRLYTYNDSLSQIVDINKVDIDRLQGGITTLKGEITKRDITIKNLRGDISNIRYRYLSDDSLIVSLKNKFKNIK